MKRCNNPECNSAFLFGNEKVVCPFCHRPLVVNGVDLNEEFLMPADRIVMDEPETIHPETFLRQHMAWVECHGRIVEIDHQELFNSRKLKFFNSLFRGEPYQFAHQTIEYTIRVESMDEGLPIELKDFCLYGSYLGRMQVGDEVIIRAVNRRDRRVVRAIYNQTTDTNIKPGFQLPAWSVRILVIMLLVIVLFLLFGLGWLIQSGIAAILLTALASAVIPMLVVLWLIWWSIKGLFRR